MENKILSQVKDLLEKQTEKGVKKYGHSVDADELTAEQWIDHASEEIVDLLVYLQCLKEKLK